MQRTILARGGYAILLLMILSAKLSAMGINPPPPPPPTAPAYTSSYYHLTWIWKGNGFDISGTVANPNGNGVTNTGGLTAFESWQLKSTGHGPAWVETGITGIYSMGTIKSSSPGYSTYYLAVSTSYILPNNVKFELTRVGNGATTPVNGVIDFFSENTATWYGSSGSVGHKTGTMSSGTSTNTATVTGSTSTDTTYNGLPDSVSVKTEASSTTYTDATKANPTVVTGSETDYENVAFPSGLTSSRSTRTSSSTMRYFTITNPDKSHTSVPWGSGVKRSLSATAWNADGSQQSSVSHQSVSTWSYLLFSKGSKLARQEATGITDVQTQGQPAHHEAVKRTTYWDDQGNPSDWIGIAETDGASSSFELDWSEGGQLLNATTNGGVNLTIPQATALYLKFFAFETTVMQRPPPSYCYPFFPSVEAPPHGPG